jgi:hypothetical protein
MDWESIGRMVITLGNTCSWKRHPSEEYIPAGNKSSWTMNQPKEWLVIPSGITGSWMLIKAGKIKMSKKKIPPNGNNSRIINSNGSLYCKENGAPCWRQQGEWCSLHSSSTV